MEVSGRLGTGELTIDSRQVQAPYRIDARTTETDTWYRFNSEDDNAYRPFFSDKQQVDTLIETGEISSVDELQSQLALPEKKTYVVKFEVEAGTKVRMSMVGDNFGGDGGLRQFEMRTTDMYERAKQLDRTDFPGVFLENDPIEVVLDLDS
ncbi:hypothetical protein [Halobacterium zhouii]|uniref:hypothetical protein n=1 Tax=Halobacterium zhouii TaxID=2902624 RepID=UPI001E2A62B2|nr:hypothetical protein [Halobacterium zhouii]